jgi:hypothetical protein
VSMQYQPGKQDVDIDKLIPPSSRPFADPGKLARQGPFNWGASTRRSSSKRMEPAFGSWTA